MSLNFSKEVSKQDVFASIRTELLIKELIVINEEKRPWGGFFVIDETQANQFLEMYFLFLNAAELLAENKLSPKILIVESGKRLSWQYHFRRAEIWKVIGGNPGVVKSDTDSETAVEIYKDGDVINLKQGERHRLVGLDDWGIIAEIWKHTNKDEPSDENDIIRLSDDFGR